MHYMHICFQTRNGLDCKIYLKINQTARNACWIFCGFFKDFLYYWDNSTYFDLSEKNLHEVNKLLNNLTLNTFHKIAVCNRVEG